MERKPVCNTLDLDVIENLNRFAKERMITKSRFVNKIIKDKLIELNAWKKAEK